MLALCSMLWHPCYAKNYAGIIGAGLALVFNCEKKFIIGEANDVGVYNGPDGRIVLLRVYTERLLTNHLHGKAAELEAELYLANS